MRAFLKSVAFGLFIAASIGPIALLVIGTAAARGLRPGLLAALGAALADLAYALLSFSAGALILPLLEAQATAIRVGSALVLIGFVPQLPLAGSLAIAGWLALGLFIGSLSIQLALAISGWLLGNALPGHGWRRNINLAGATGMLAFGLIGLFLSM